MDQKDIPTKNNIARAAGTVMVAFIISNLTGLLRDILITNAFGTQASIDAFNAANRVSETLFLLVAGGALSSAFIPTFTGLLAHQDRARAWKLASAIVNIVILVLIFLALLSAVFAPQIVRYVLVPGFADHPVQESLTVELLRVMLPSAVIFGLSGLVMGILNSHQIFFIPALAPSLYQIGLIFGVLVLSPRMGIFGLAWGVLLGASLHLLFQLPTLFRLKGEYLPTFGIRMPEVREVILLMLPRLLGVAVVQLNFWINARLASFMQTGSYTGLVLAFRLMLMPQAAIAQSVAIAAMPTFSTQYALGKLDEMRNSLAASLRGTLLLTIPAMIGLIILRVPIISLLYQRGEFDKHSTELVGWALLWFAVGLVGHSLVEVTSRAFYSLHDTRTPVLIGTVAMSLNVIFSFAFSGLFRRIGWMPHGGLALANSLATGLEACGLYLLMSRRLGGIEGKHILNGVYKSIGASTLMSGALIGWLFLFNDGSVWIITLGGLILGVFVYLITGLLFGISEFRVGLKAVGSRMGLVRSE